MASLFSGPRDSRPIDLSAVVNYPAPYLRDNPGPFADSEYLNSPDGKGMYHLHLKPDQVSRNVIIVGDPGRATSVAEKLFLEKAHEQLVGMLDDVAEVVEHRGLRSITGTVRGTDFRLTVTTSGMGVGTTEIADVELMLLREIDLASRTRKDEFEPFNLVRLGTCGALQPDLKLGVPVVTEYALDLGGVLQHYEVPAPDEFARRLEREAAQAIKSAMDPDSRFYGKIAPVASKCDPGLVQAIMDAAKDEGIECLRGITVTNAGFFAPQGRDVLRIARSVQDIDQALAGINTGVEGLRVLNMEMEIGTLAGINNPSGYPTTAVCVPVAHRVSNTAIDPETYAKGLEDSLRLVVAGLQRFSASGKVAAPYQAESRPMTQLEALVERVHGEGYGIPREEIAKGIEVAVEMAKRAHAAYTPEVAGRGAALICRGADGNYSIVPGCDIQSAAYPSSTTAVAGAIHQARLEGLERGIEGVVIYESSGVRPVIFGAERDLLGVFADKIPVVQISNTGKVKITNFESEAGPVREATASYVPDHLPRVGAALRGSDAILKVTALNLTAVYDVINPPFSYGSFEDAVLKAVSSSTRAFAPFSKYEVGASLLVNGKLVGGTNVETLPFSTGICAERTALEIAAAEGLFDWNEPGFREQLDMLVVYVPKAEPAAPCGACRQALTEITAARPILMVCESGKAIYAEGLSSGRVFEIDAKRGEEPSIREIGDGGLLKSSFGRQNLG